MKLSTSTRTEHHNQHHSNINAQTQPHIEHLVKLSMYTILCPRVLLIHVLLPGLATHPLTQHFTHPLTYSPLPTDPATHAPTKTKKIQPWDDLLAVFVVYFAFIVRVVWHSTMLPRNNSYV